MIIKSILDTDLYKFTTSYAYMKLFPQARGTFEFIDRDNTEYPEDSIGISTNAIKGQLGGEENEVKAIMWIKMSNLDDYQWAFGHDKLIKGLYTLIPDIRNLLEN